MRILFDTNVLYAAFGYRGFCHELLLRCLGSHEILTSTYILDELERKLRRKLQMPTEERKKVLHFLQRTLLLVRDEPNSRLMCRDKKDVPILSAALAGTADIIVTGDKDLLQLKQVHNIPILNPRQLHHTLGIE